MRDNTRDLAGNEGVVFYQAPCPFRFREITCAEFIERGGLSRLLDEYERIVGSPDQEDVEP